MNDKPISIKGFEVKELLKYTIRQVNYISPLDNGRFEIPEKIFILALERLSICINSIRLWQPGIFDPLNSSQYATFLYFLSNSLWRENNDTEAATRLFLLNKALNAIDCFYELNLPSKFLIGHSVGIVLAKAEYGERLVIYQNSTVGRNFKGSPKISDDVILFPNSAVLGTALIGKGSVVSQGTTVRDKSLKPNCIAFQTWGHNFIQKPIRRKIIEDYFRN